MADQPALIAAQTAFLEAVECCKPSRLLPPAVLQLRQLAGLDPNEPAAVVSLGKAAVGMRDALAACHPAGPSIAVTKDESDPLGLALFGGHPHPTEASLAAGRAVWEFAQGLPDQMPVVGLISGGASALCEHLKPGRTLADAWQLVGRSFAEGWPIERLNRERQAISQIKLGGLARLLGGRLKGVIALSDVGPASPDQVLGSGPFYAGGNIPFIVAGDRFTALDAATRALERQGYRVVLAGEMSGEARSFALGPLREAALGLAPGTAAVWCGETVATVMGPGRGGRCQEIICAASSWIGLGSGLALLAAGTDGTDGPTDAAGAVIGSHSKLPEGASQALMASDSYAWCARAEALLMTGSTGTNLNDIVIAITA